MRKLMPTVSFFCWGILYNELGIAFLAFELTMDSVSCFRQSLKHLVDDGSLIKASVLQNLGSACIAAKNYSEAISALKKAALFFSKF